MVIHIYMYMYMVVIYMCTICKVNILSFVVFYCNKDVWFKGCTVGLNQFVYMYMYVWLML